VDPHSLKVLEFAAVLDLVAAGADTGWGRERIRRLRPARRYGWLKNRLDEVGQAILLLDQFGSLPLGGVRDLRSTLRAATRGSTLAPAALLEVAQTLSATGRVLGFSRPAAAKVPALAPYLEALDPLPQVTAPILRSVGENGQVKDDATRRLAEIRNGIRISASRIQDRLRSFLHNPATTAMLQEALVTTRQGRYVIPIKAEYRSRFPGVVWDQSASGATVFMEPMEVVEADNDLRNLQLEERREVNAILEGLTGLVGAHQERIQADIQALAELDLLQALARFSIEFSAVLPEINHQGYFRLEKARHPILGKRAIPIDLEVGGEFNALIVTGPNTGGKTVTLKTLGLFTLMALAGIPLPAARAQVPFIDKVFADIGDEQSISQNLSTFSSHMTRILGMLPRADSRSLLLLDELGAGTDPSEGSALGMALLEHLQERGARVVVTTHYSRLKAFAASQPGMQNAAMEFDPETLLPTFRIVIGLPGRSCAFDVASRLGMPEPLVSRSRNWLEGGEIAVDTLLRQIQEERDLLHKALADAQRQRLDLEKFREAQEGDAGRTREELERLERDTRNRMTRELDAVREGIRSARSALEEGWAREAQKLADDYHAQQDELRRVIDSLRKMRTRPQLASTDLELLQEGEAILAAQGPDLQRALLREGKRSVSRLIDKGLEEVRRLEEKVPVPPPPIPRTAGKPLAESEIRPGRDAWIEHLGRPGTILAHPRQGKVMVRLGPVRLEVPVEHLVELPEAPPPSEGESHWTRPQADRVKLELDLRGKRVDEAIALVEKFLDDAMLSELTSVRLIHGKGTGALRQAVGEYLKNHPRVRDFRLGEAGEGDWGVTVVGLE